MSTRIGLGTAAIGRPLYINIKLEKERGIFDLGDFKKTGMRFLETAYTLGITHFDTAPGYGIAEEMLLDWLANNMRRDIDLSSKWGYSYVAGFNEQAQLHELKEHSLKKLMSQWEQTKKLLPHLKTYQIHSATLESAVLENKEVLDKLHEIKQAFGIEIGFTTSGAQQNKIIEKALSIVVDGKTLFSSVQVSYNIFEQSFVEFLEIVRNSNMKIIVKESLANGRIFKNGLFKNYNAAYLLLDELSEKYDVNADAIALRFVMDTITPEILLLGATTKEQLVSNLKCNNFILTPTEIQKLKNLKVGPKQYWNERANLNWN